ncbi:MAG: hypothetical protein Q8933_11850 [Bacteroidota bacterium]|nr:hypothetical protein [Bacteroidota bacterium]
MSFNCKYAVIGILTILVVFLSAEIFRISKYRYIPELPPEDIKTEDDDIYFELSNGAKEIDWRRLNSTLKYIDSQYDVSDFHLATIIRLLYEYPDKIPPEVLANINKVLLRFRYWMDEPGENSMCYWSENHQILFASAEYLIGQLNPGKVFTNSGLTGYEHMERASRRINDWLEMRWKYGFSEFYSNVYYNEDIAGLINLIDFAKDKSISKRSEIIMDLLMYDIASQKSNNIFVTVSGRAYERSRKGGRQISINRITNHIWDRAKEIAHPHINYGFITSKRYKLPQVLFEIGKDTSNIVIKQSNGLNISELEKEGYNGTNDRSIMMQWGMEAFSNPEVIKNSIGYIRINNLFSNMFFKEFRKLDLLLIRALHLEVPIVKLFNPQYNGSAIQRANTYTYKRSDYSVYSVQNYFPGCFSNQVHITGMNIGSSFSIFHLHPAVEKWNKNQSPNYWVGYGRLPYTVQDSSVSISIYNLPDKKAAFEMDMLHYTHAYFPKQMFDSVLVIKNYAFGLKGNTYCALIGKNPLYYRNGTSDDLIQQGDKVFWIIEAGDKASDGSFYRFVCRILKNKVEFNFRSLTLNYISKKKTYLAKYCGGFQINGHKINTSHMRFDSPYIKSKLKSDFVSFNFKGKFLRLNFYKMQREYN